MNKKELVGLILCGGHSNRMGTDKGLILFQGDPWVNHRIRTLKSYTNRCLISIRKEQIASYKAVVPDLELVEDIYQNVGPVSGILSAHNRFPKADFLVLACDMPVSDSSIFSELLTAYLCKPGKRSYAWKSERHIEPFPSIYTAELLSEVSFNINRFDSQKSPKRILEESDGHWLNVRSDTKNAFLNYNTLSDLQLG
ncbi:molybdenum cofactor guanylyltransferase [Leptospira sp. WS92.C1]